MTARGFHTCSRNRLLLKRRPCQSGRVSRERVRQLIDLGGLMAKARPIELTNGDRALI
jgi:hypothetical protein